MPDYQAALRECFRCLKPGGDLLFGVPFERSSEKNIVRAKVSSNGEVVHLLEPEYHGDPLSPAGVLCFYHATMDVVMTTIDWGASQAIVVAADYDGDGKADIAIYRNGLWFIRRSSDGV